MLQDECNGFLETCKAFFPRRALTIGPRDFGAVGDVPWALLLDDCGEFIVHICILSFEYADSARTAWFGVPVVLLTPELKKSL